MHYRLLIGACFLVAAEAQPTPRFDVVSIHLVPPNAPPIMREVGATSVHPGGVYIDQRVMISSLILFAYDVPAYFQLTGIPDGTKNQSYSISAKPGPDFPALAPAQNKEQVRLMMRALLAEPLPSQAAH